MDMARMEDWLSAIPSKYTRKTYKSGIKKFEQFYEKSIEDLLSLSDEETGHIIEKFYVWLKEKGHGQNTCRNLINSPIQYLKYFGKNPKYRKSIGMYRTVLSTRDHMVTVNEVQEMAKVADLREQVLLEVFLLGLRVRDVSELKWQTFAVKGETPIPILILTRKEGVTARTFISAEFKGLLIRYLPTLDKSNPFLFQSKKWTKTRKGIQNLGTKQIENILKGLVKRASIESHGVLAWHSGRKLFLRRATELGVSHWSAKFMVGKSVPASDNSYVYNVELKDDFLKVSEVLRLFPKIVPENSDRTRQLESALVGLERENAVLKTRIEVMQKEFGITEEALADILRPLIPQVLEEIVKKKGMHISRNYSVIVKSTPHDIIEEYLYLKGQLKSLPDIQQDGKTEREKGNEDGKISIRVETNGKTPETMLKKP
jgi:integrase